MKSIISLAILAALIAPSVHGLSCYYCPHYDDKCSESNPGDTVACQMDDPTQDHYGDTCMVDHYVRTVDKVPVTDMWWRGCRQLKENEQLGCEEHITEHTGYDIVVDECICKTDLCNKEMGPIPPTH